MDHGVFRLLLGATILLAPGSGLLAAPWTVSSAGGGAFAQISEAIISTSVMPGDELVVLPGTYEGFVVDKPDLTIRGVNPALCKVVGVVDGAVLKENVNCRLHGLSFTGRYGILIEGLASHQVQNCIVTGCAQSGIYVTAWDGSIAITNTIAAYNGVAGIYATNHTGGEPRSLTVANCILAHNAEQGFGGGGSGIFPVNCLYYANAGGTGPLGSGSLQADPRFVDANAGNFQLSRSPLSPCINAGVVGPAHLDPDGTRNDIGAFGGPGSLGFFPDPNGGPRITELVVEPAVVPQGGTITIRASATAE